MAAAAVWLGCAELKAIFYPPPPPLFEPSVEKPKGVLFLEFRGVMLPFVCGADGSLARDKGCAGKVDEGSTLRTEVGEGLAVAGTAPADCGAGDGLEVTPAPAKHAVAFWSADGRGELVKLRDASAFSTQAWQRLTPKIEALATPALGGAPVDMVVTSWAEGDFDGDKLDDLLLAVEAKAPAGSTAAGYWAVLLDRGGEERRLGAIVEDTKERKNREALVAVVDVDGDGQLEFLTSGEIWSLWRTIEGEPKSVASWFCYRRGD